MIYFAFTLSMPNNNSWNGRWSGESRYYAVVRRFRDTKKGAALLERLRAKPIHYYNFGDGWVASVLVEEVDPDKARQVRKKSNGFCGYDWMVDSILDHGDIRIVERAAARQAQVSGGRN